jgi:hypothetical protein
MTRPWACEHGALLIALLLAAGTFACSTDAASPSSDAGGSSVSGGAQAGGQSAGNPSGGSPSGSSGATSAGAPTGGVGGTAGASTAGSGGSTAGTSSGGGPSNPTSFCEARPGLLFCEDFETMAKGAVVTAAPWSAAVNGEGSVTIDDAQSHSGQQALRVLGSGFSSFLVYSDPNVLPAPAGRFYLRAFLRLSEAMTGGHNTFIIGDMAESPGTGNALRLGEMHQMLMYTVTGDTHGALANENFYIDQLPGAALTAATWGCLEMLVDSSAPELRVWLDGQEIADLHHTDFPIDAYDALRFGFEKYAGPESELFYDDLAIGSQPIGCD